MRQSEKPWDTLPYHPEEITELYLGLAMTTEARQEIIGKAKAVNPNIAIFQTSRDANQMLIFQSID
jgi:hypothetical protein